MSWRRAGWIVAGCAVLALATATALHARRASTITVRLQPGASEPRDRSLPGMISLERPDYRLELRTDDHWLDCGTHRDSTLGGGLSWTVDSPVPWHTLAAIRLWEADPLRDELLAELPVDGLQVTDARFVVDLERVLSPTAGIRWLVDHWTGRVLFALLGLLLAGQLLQAAA